MYTTFDCIENKTCLVFTKSCYTSGKTTLRTGSALKASMPGIDVKRLTI